MADQDTLNARLLRAVNEGDLNNSVSRLIKEGADINAIGTSAANYRGSDGKLHKLEGLTPLDVAVSHGNAPLIEDLIGNGAKVNAKNDFGMTALHYAAAYGDTRTAKLLIEHRADVNVTNPRDNMTPLHYAAFEGRNPETAELLIKRGAKLDARGRDGDSPLDLAITAGDKATQTVLKEAMQIAPAQAAVLKEVAPAIEAYVRDRVALEYEAGIRHGKNLETGETKKATDQMYHHLESVVEKAMQRHGLDTTRDRGGFRPEFESNLLYDAQKAVFDKEAKWPVVYDTEAKLDDRVLQKPGATPGQQEHKQSAQKAPK
jgi:hypothetical protein